MTGARNLPVLGDESVERAALKGLTIAVIGYGAQGRAQARMLASRAQEYGMSIVVGLRQGSALWEVAVADGLQVSKISDAVSGADVIHILAPDEAQKALYETQIEPQLRAGQILSFSHGFAVTFGYIKAPEGVGIMMVAPKAPGTEMYKAFLGGRGVPALIAVHQDTALGNVRAIALTMCQAMGFTRSGVFECTFAEETHQDLFGEQAVLCGGISELIKAGFEVLVERGYPPEVAYIECLHETKLVVDLIVAGGLEHMWKVVSNTAEFGGVTRGRRIITSDTKRQMHAMLDEIQNGSFAAEMMNEYEQAGMQNLVGMRSELAEHQIEKVGRKMRDVIHSVKS
jgi:ketol-acid reductoisomerase